MAPCRSSASAASARLNAEAAAYKRQQGAAGARLNAEAASYGKRKHRRSNRPNADSLRYQAQAASLRRSKHTGSSSGALGGFVDVPRTKKASCGS